MLVLTRKAGEGIIVGSDIRLVVLDVKGRQVRLGVEAPSTVQIHRDEVYARILDENQRAAVASLNSLEAVKHLSVRRRVESQTEFQPEPQPEGL